MTQLHGIEFAEEQPAATQSSPVQALQDGTTANRALAVTVALSFLLLLAAALLVFQISRESAGAEAAVVHTLSVKQASSELLNMLSTAESGQRGYLITRDQSLLGPLHAVRRDLDEKLRELQALVSDDPAQSARLEELTPMIIERLGAIQQTLSLSEAGRQSDAARVVVERGAPLMEAVHRHFAQFEAAEDQLLLARQQHAAAISQQFLRAVTAMLVACGILAVFALISVRRYLHAIQHSRARLAAYNKELERRVRERTEELARTAEVAERERMRAETLLTDVNHRVGNNLALVSSFLTMQQRVVKNPDAARALGAARARVQAIASAHRKLRLGADFASVKAGDVLGAVLEDISAGLPPGDLIKIEHHVEPVEISARDAVTLGVLTSELVINAVKHAFVPGTGGLIKVVLSIGTGAVPILEISDNGVGWHEKNTRETGGLGARIVEMVAKQYGSSPERFPRESGTARPGTCVRSRLEKLQVLH
jgi:two-component sensor histidine kinase/CHASE3 domain sensor protein